jgi:hypothetical protein
MDYLGAAILALLCLAGCSTTPLSADLRAYYVGTKVDAFFHEWGGPVSSVRTDHGGRIYLWFSGRDSAFRPGDRGTVDLIGNTAWWRGHSLDNYNPLRECRVDIVTGRHGQIVDLRIHPGNRDWWDVQRCQEVFGGRLRR